MNDIKENLTHNQPEFTISQLSNLLKRTVEDAFSYVRIRGEISAYKKAASGHVYLNLKDDNSVINGVIWKGVAAKLNFVPEDGMEVICTGKISTYAARSNYQITIDTMEIAGEGALMALLEKRKKQFIKEGLFDESRKQALPFLPKTIGIVTSPTGAVIRDILHRLQDRFPVHVLLWPVLVQGEKAKDEVTHAINGFNAFPAEGEIPKPDLLIIARGGGSIEDLWAFNEECVVRATANSTIPVISAIGHETDTTLIDFVSDKRAPTPTAAAEMAVPVRSELVLTVMDYEKRLYRRLTQMMTEHQNYLDALSRGLTSPTHLINTNIQRLDDWSERLHKSLPSMLEQKHKDLAHLSSRFSPTLILRDIERKHQHIQAIAIPTPHQFLERIEQKLNYLGTQLNQHYSHTIKQKQHQLNIRSTRLSPTLVNNHIATLKNQLELHSKLLESYHYKKVLERGYTLIWDENNAIITSAKQLQAQQHFTIEHVDGKTEAQPVSGTDSSSKKTVKKSVKKSADNNTDTLKQTSLF